METNNANSKPVSQTDRTRFRSSAHPRYTLQQAENLARYAFKTGPRNCEQNKLAKELKYSGSNNGAFVAIRASASQFGMITYEKGYISVSEEWIKVLNSEDPTLLQEARRNALLRPNLYNLLVSEYKDKQLPGLDRLTRDLHINPRYNILKDAAEGAAENFLDSARFAGVLDSKGYLRLASQQTHQSDDTTMSSAKTDDMQRDYVESSDNKLERFEARSDTNKIPAASDGLDRLEVQLSNGKKAYLFVPVPLPANEKARLKAYIDLLLEEETSKNPLLTGG